MGAWVSRELRKGHRRRKFETTKKFFERGENSPNRQNAMGVLGRDSDLLLLRATSLKKKESEGPPESRR